MLFRSCVNVMGAYDNGASRGQGALRPYGGAADGRGIAGMDFVGGELNLLSGSSGRRGAVLDPLEFFVKTLSASPNSKTMFADKLLIFAGDTPGGMMRTNLSPALSTASMWGAGDMMGVREAGGVVEMGDEEADADQLVQSVEFDIDKIDSADLDMAMALDTQDTLAGLDYGTSYGTSTGHRPTISSTTSDEFGGLGLGLIDTRSSGYSVGNDAFSAGGMQSATFSDVSADEYAFGASSLGSGGLGTQTQMRFPSDDADLDLDLGMHAGMVSGTGNGQAGTRQESTDGQQAQQFMGNERVMGVW